LQDQDINVSSGAKKIHTDNPQAVEALDSKEQKALLANIAKYLGMDKEAQQERDDIEKDADLRRYYCVVLRIGWTLAAAQAASSGQVAKSKDTVDTLITLSGAAVESLPGAALIPGQNLLTTVAQEGATRLNNLKKGRKSLRTANLLPDAFLVTRLAE